MTRLILVPPLNHLETFITYCDGVGIHASPEKDIPSEVFSIIERHSKPLVILNGYIPEYTYRSCTTDELIAFLDKLPFSPYMVQCPEEGTNYIDLVDKMFSILHYFQAHKNWTSFKFLLTFKGGEKNLKLLLGMQVANPMIEIGLRWNDLGRIKFVNKDNSPSLTYLGFRNLDELMIKPPRYLITASPFQAAMMGISLRERERRPKGLIQETQFNMTEERIKYSIFNINAIREALCMTL